MAELELWKECGHLKTEENTCDVAPTRPKGRCRMCKRAIDAKYNASDEGIARIKRRDDNQAVSGEARAKREARIASGKHAQCQRAVYQKRQTYIAELYADTPDKRIIASADRLVVLSDIHIPFEDPGAVDQALDVIHRIQPDTVVLNGDIVDCYMESSFLKDMQKARAAIPESHRRARLLMEALKHIPHKYWLGGNHEDRWRKTLWGGGSGAIALNLQAAWKATTGTDVDLGDPTQSFAALYDMSGYGFTYYPYGYRLYFADGNLVVTHGKYISKHSGGAAKRTWEWLGKSAIVGHSHKLGNYVKTQDERETGAWENGCLCHLEPEYDDTPDWQQAFSIVWINGPEFHVVQVPIVRRGKVPVAVYHGEAA